MGWWEMVPMVTNGEAFLKETICYQVYITWLQDRYCKNPEKGEFRV